MSMDDILYGVRTGDPQDLAAVLTPRLGSPFETRDSDYLGQYCRAHTPHGEIKILVQPDPEGDPFEDDFPDYRLLIYVNAEGNDIDLSGIAVGNSVIERLR
jgi:hypothetical protein